MWEIVQLLYSWSILDTCKKCCFNLIIMHSFSHAAPPYHEVTIKTDPPEGPYPLGSTVIFKCSVTPPPPEGVTYRWTDSIPSTYLSSAQPNLTLTIPAHHPSQGHYYCTVSNGSSVLGVGCTTVDVRGELDIYLTCSYLLCWVAHQILILLWCLPDPNFMFGAWAKHHYRNLSGVGVSMACPQN